MADGELSIIVDDAGTATAIQRKLSYLLDDAEVREGITKIVRDEVNKFVPKNTGNLASQTEIYEDEIIWTAPYAHYQYTGIVYGPNIPTIINGEPGWRSPKGKEKYPTGRRLQYHTEGTGAYWDLKMMQNANARRIMNIRITAYLKRMAKERDL